MGPQVVQAWFTKEPKGIVLVSLTFKLVQFVSRQSILHTLIRVAPACSELHLFASLFQVCSSTFQYIKTYCNLQHFIPSNLFHTVIVYTYCFSLIQLVQLVSHRSALLNVVPRCSTLFRLLPPKCSLYALFPTCVPTCCSF